MNRTILHADLDAFFASVEQLERPELQGKPVLVGGPVETRGVVAAASYEARRYGVRSAMSMSKALRLCPQAVRVSPRFDRYAEISRQVMRIFRSVTPLVEPLSLDEAFLDATAQVASYGGPEALGRYIKGRVKREVGLTVSVGAGASKSVAKIASDMGKPDGLVVVPWGKEEEFLRPLPARALWGVGPKTEGALTSVGIRTIGDLAAASDALVDRLFGSRGRELRDMASGHDRRAVETEHERKSVGAETTFPRDLPAGAELHEHLGRLAEQISRHLKKEGLAARTVVLKLRYRNFTTITRQATGAEPIDDAEEIARRASDLLRKVARPGDLFRLVGIHCSHLRAKGVGQLSLWMAAGESSAVQSILNE